MAVLVPATGSFKCFRKSEGVAWFFLSFSCALKREIKALAIGHPRRALKGLSSPPAMTGEHKSGNLATRRDASAMLLLLTGAASSPSEFRFEHSAHITSFEFGCVCGSGSHDAGAARQRSQSIHHPFRVGSHQGNSPPPGELVCFIHQLPGLINAAH